MLLAVNPSKEPLELKLDGKYQLVYHMGESAVAGEKLTVGAQSLAVLKPVE